MLITRRRAVPFVHAFWISSAGAIGFDFLVLRQALPVPAYEGRADRHMGHDVPPHGFLSGS